jgi:plastocyanin
MSRGRIAKTTALAAIILSVALLPIACGGKSKNPTSPGGGGGGGGAADVTISIVANNGANSYSPSPDTVSVGQTVSWHNVDSLPHTATENSGTPVFDTGTLGSGQTSGPIAMTTAGTFPYHCTIHGLSMSGTLVVNP